MTRLHSRARCALLESNIFVYPIFNLPGISEATVSQYVSYMVDCVEGGSGLSTMASRTEHFREFHKSGVANKVDRWTVQPIKFEKSGL